MQKIFALMFPVLHQTSRSHKKTTEFLNLHTHKMLKRATVVWEKDGELLSSYDSFRDVPSSV